MRRPHFQNKDYLELILDMSPVMLFVVDRDVRILDANEAAEKVVEKTEDSTIGNPCGDVIRCVNALQAEGGCGTSKFCPDCVIRNSVLDAFKGKKITRKYQAMRLKDEKGERPFHVQVSTTPIEVEGEKLVLLTLEDVTELYELREIIPICSVCKKVRTDKAYWEQVESYLLRHNGIKFSHGICPDCMKKHYPDY
ncbi:MAG: PAS domain-containing protein [Deltaproteobacteria bacterium]|nr:PAS domain-containing protein [Deltaproteobacteria bacterium]